ncbi:MAG TPA: hypothetical protein VJZ93_00585 [Candidatus Nanoarchaeia archaeon]|nr:hypothetical protein [Candidatus Nanoarchaeia archaeon]
MTKLLQIALPLMLHFDKEIEAFLEAKDRIEILSDSYGVPTEVGAFLPFLPGHSIKSENFEKQLENERKYGIPIRLVETCIQRNNSLAYVPSDPTYNSEKPSDLGRTIDHVARLRDLDPNPRENLVVAPHVGVIVPHDLKEGDFSIPGFYSVPDFVKMRDKIIDTAESRFAGLQELGIQKGLTLAIENAYLAVVQDSSFWQTGNRTEDMDKYKMHYEVLNDLPNLSKISRGNLVLDLAHLVAMEEIPNAFSRNNFSPDNLFATMGISSWDEYEKRVGMQEEYMAQARAVHISQVEGIGVRLPANSEPAQHWGGGKTLQGLIPKERFVDVLKESQRRNLPVSLELDYSFKPFTYKEADDLLEPILKIYDDF